MDNKRTILVIGSVTSRQYSALRKRMVRKDMKPVVMRLDVEDYQRKMRRIWASYKHLQGGYFLFEGTSSSASSTAYDSAKRRQDEFLDEFIAQFGSVYAICWSPGSSPEYTDVLAERLHDRGKELRQFRVQPSGKLEQTSGPEIAMQNTLQDLAYYANEVSALDII